MAVITFILLLGAFVSFICAALGVTTQRINLIALGLALWVLTVLLPLLAVALHEG